MQLGILAAVVRDAEELAGFGGGLGHRAGVEVAEGHRLLAEHVFSGAQRGDRLRRVERDGGGDIDGVDGGIAQGFVEIAPHVRGVAGALGGIARDDAIKGAARLGDDRRDDAPHGDVADSDDDPIQHESMVSGWFGDSGDRSLTVSALTYRACAHLTLGCA